MTSPNRSVVVRLALDPSSYVAGASRAEASTLSLDRAVSKVGPSSATSMEQAAKGAGTAEGALGKLNKTAGALGFTLGGLAGVGAGIAAALSVKWAGDYQQSLTKLATTAGESQKNLHMVGQGMLDMAGQVGIGADELAKGMYTVESSGIHGANALIVLKAAAQGARQENADLSKVTDAVTTALHDYNLPASDAAKVTSMLVTAVSHGKTTFDELTGAMHSVTPLAAALHVPLADVAGVLSSMTASGESADQAAQNMADTLRHLQNPTSTMTAELAQLGITSSDLSTQLSTRGLSGTLQGISEAILTKIDPATQKVLLPAFNQSKTAAQDLNIMIGHMPPALAKLSQSLLDGATTQGEYRKAAQALGGQAGVLGDNFLGLYKTSDGFNNIIKAGGPAAQVYTAALQKAVGTSAGLTVALQVTGEHAAATNAAIKDIGKSAGDTQGNIKGWDEVQGNFNQQLAQTEQGLRSLAIEAGQHLLPVLGDTFGYVNRDVIPGLEHVGSGVGTAVHWFMQLPGPVKEAALALAGLKVITGTDMFAGLLASGRVVAVGFAHDMGNMVTSARAGVASMTAAFTEAKAAQQALTAERFGMDLSMVSKATGDLSGLGAAAGVAAKGGLSAMKSAAGGVVNMLGGPWVVATAGAVVGVVALMDAIKRHDAEIKAATLDVQKWNEAISLDGSGQSAIQAQSHLEDLRQKLAGVTAEIDKYNAAAQGGYARGGIGTLVSQQAELRGELDKGSKAWKDQLAAMTPVQEATARVQLAEHDLQMDRKTNAPNSQILINDEIRLSAARDSLTGETDRANAAEKTRIQRLQDSANATLGLVDANRAAMEASLNLTQQVSDYNKQIADGTLKGDALSSATLGIVDSAEQAAKAAGDAAAQQAKQNGATDTGSASQAAFMKSLQDAASTMTGPAKKALQDYIAQLGGQQSQAQLTAGAINSLGVTVTDLPDSHLITINVPTDDQMKKLHDLGYATVTLPNGKVIVTADTNPAQSEIQDLLNYARQQSIQYRSDLPDLVPGVSGGGRMGHAATGGWISGPGSGTSDSVPMWLSDGEFVVNAASASQHADLLQTINSGMGRMAAGGWVNVPAGGWFAGQSNVPVSVDETQAKAAIAQMYKAAAAAFAPGAPGNVNANAALAQQMAARYYGWGGAEWNALYALGKRESGWNNNAQNPTSTAYGIPQFLNSTWATVGLSKTSNPAVQIAGMDKYIEQRYGDPINAWAHETKFGWYHNGGTVQGPVGADVPAMLKVGETVRTSEQEAIVQRALRSREFAGSAVSGGSVRSTTNYNTYNVAAAGPSERQMVRALADHQYQQEFLNG